MDLDIELVNCDITAFKGVMAPKKGLLSWLLLAR